tara:strand:+ start:3141 stop:3545 length:405 start_codon:yes stop_codon:yes gene_type:complete
MQKKKLDKKAKKSTKSTKAKGLGDTVEQVLEATGIAKVAKWVLGEDCGCEERKQKLNDLYPYYKPKCLTEDEYNYLDTYYTENNNVVQPEVQKEIVKIYNRVFTQRQSLTSCSSCYKKTIHDKLKNVYNEYKNQ